MECPICKKYTSKNDVRVILGMHESLYFCSEKHAKKWASDQRGAIVKLP